MNTKQFQYVLTLAQESSFSRAADILNITQPSLSQYIKKIEREVGLQLFDRTNGEVRITDAGKVYIETAQQILDLEHQMETSFSDIAANRAGSLIIGAAPYRAASMMPTISRSFQALHPGMHLVVREGTTAELAEGMEHGEFDLALTLLPIDGRLFSWEKVVEEELVLAVPSGFPQPASSAVPSRKFPAVDAKTLNGQRMVMLTDAQYMQKQLQNILIDHMISIRPAAIVKSLEAQIEFVKAGVGIALVPSGIERFCKDGTVAFYSFTDPLPRREVVVMWRKDRKLSKVAMELKDVIRGIQW
ncbi:MAG: LysR family transcriptional regulator [Clostridia bacterium]|nr:LysR family transcriptional regulator [Clostridia bacterium]